MRKSDFYGVDVPELGDRADITVVSQAIVDGENNQSGRVEHLKATNSGATLILNSETRADKLIKYYNGLSVQFVSPIDMTAGNSYKIQIDNLAEQPYNNKTDIKAGDIVQAYYGTSGFVSSNTPIPRSSSTSSSSEVTVATSLAVKNANDNANTRALKTIQVIAGNGLTGGGTLEANRTINVVSADDSIVVGADNIKVNTYNGVDSTSTTRPASANAVKNANDNANGRLPIAGGTLTGAVNFANNTWNKFGDDVSIGDCNQSGKIGIKGLNGATGIYFYPYSGSTVNTISIDGAGNLTISGITIGTFKGNISGNADTATKLQTARTINGTNFDGAGNITTANWGTARTLTIGSTGKSVNGSANVSWSLSEIGVYSKSEVDSKISAICPYKVGDIFLTTNATNPSTVWLGTTWSKIEGRMLLGTSGSGASKATGGSNTATLTTANMPSHTHSASQSAHTHSRGTQDIVGTWHNTTENQYWQEPTGAIFRTKLGGDGVTGTSGWFDKMTLQASRNWTGSTTSVQPAVTVGATGSGSAFSILSSYYTVHMWLRLT